ncbi:MAG: MinD/ParA family protein [Desulfobulbaceae bacterium]|nr:MinD/ParA family protein [Desulfobulbaceae bacterium]
MASGPERKSIIMAVGGGKGGVGKSFVMASLGMSLARQGRVVMIDGDLGGANLHNFLGISRPASSLTDFFERKVPLVDLVVNSGIANLGLLTGMVGTIGGESIKHAQKQKLFNQIKKLDADYILIDLGAGTHFNTIDTLLLADKMIIVITPEIVSIENMYNFLRNLYFRRLGSVLSDHGHRELVVNTWRDRDTLGITNFRQLVDCLKAISVEVKSIIEEELRDFAVNLVLNKARTNQDIITGNSVKSICIKFFGVNALYSGYIEHDELVSRSANLRTPYLAAYPTSRCARGIERLTGNILSGQQVKVTK